MVKYTFLTILLTFLVLSTSASAYTYYEPLSMSNITNSIGTPLATGDITALFYLTETSTTPIYNQTFADSIDNGKFDELISSADFTVTVYYASVYYLDILVNDENATFYNNTKDRYNFTFSTGVINSTHLNNSAALDNINTWVTTNHSNWDESYEWGNHSDAGYLTTNVVNTTEEMQDAVMAAIDDGTQTHITVTYQDTTNDMDFVVSDDWYDSVSDIPTATPSDGDTTHVSTADQIWDWIISLDYATENTNVTFEDVNISGDYWINDVKLNSSHIPDHNGHTVRDTFKHIINRGKAEAITVAHNSTGLGINWTVGELYCSSCTTFFTTTAGSGSLTDNVPNYLKWVSGSDLTISTSSSSGDEILIATFSVYDDVINSYREHSIIKDSIADTRRGLRLAFPNRVISGMSVSEDADVTNALDVTMSSGVLVKDGIEEKTPIQIDSRTTNLVRHFHSGGAWTHDTDAEINTTHYDDGTNLVEIPANKWVKAYFIFMNGKIGWIFPTECFTVEGDAEASSLSAIPPGLEPVPKLTAIVYQQGDADFTGTTWQDIRPGISEESFNIVTDHGSLAGLGDDDHPQYMELDGTDTLTGTWDVGGFDILNENGNITAYDINATNNLYVGSLQATDGNSVYVQPDGDTDDYFTFKTPSDRPTIKREGGKFIYFESTNVYDVGISLRDDDTYSGTLNYEKDDHKMTLLGKNSPVAIKTNSEYVNYFLFETTDHQPQLSAYNASYLNIADNLTVDGYINSTDWTNVSITESQVSDADWWDADGDINADEISESKINFVTACGGGNHYYLNGNDLACEANTVDTSADTVCSGTTTYMDGDGNCDDISSVYVNDGCSDCLNAQEIEDIYVLSSEDTMTGALTIDSSTDTTLFNVSKTGTGAGNAVVITNKGTDDTVYINTVGNSKGIVIDSQASTAGNYGIDIKMSSSATAALFQSTASCYTQLGIDYNSGIANNWFYRDIASANTNAPIALFEQDNAGDDKDTITSQNDGSGDNFVCVASGTGACLDAGTKDIINADDINATEFYQGTNKVLDDASLSENSPYLTLSGNVFGFAEDYLNNTITDLSISSESDPYWTANQSSYSTKAVADTLYQPLEATLTDIADGTIAENLVNTANPWADNEVSDTLTVTGYMQDSDINTFSELQSWVSDEVLLKSGTLTDGKVCKYDLASTDVICNYDDANTQLTEDQVEAYILDSDNTANLDMNNYNVTVNTIVLENDQTNHRIYDNATCVFIRGDTSTLTIC